MKIFNAFIISLSLLSTTTFARSVPQVPEFKSQDPRSLSHPQKKNRFCYCMFGHDLKYFDWLPFYKVKQILNPGNIGQQNYSKGNRHEKNGQIYTCDAGFVDFSHMRAGIDWAAYIAFSIAQGKTEIVLEDEDHTTMTFSFNGDYISSPEDIARIAERAALERLIWHEVASWHYIRPIEPFGEQISAFSPEDLTSNYIGAHIGSVVAIRMLNDPKLDYSTVADEEIKKMMAQYHAVKTKRATEIAFDQVDRAKGAENPWWDSKIAMSHNRYLFKRNTEYIPYLKPWLVPNAEKAGCEKVTPQTFAVAETLTNGESIFKAYEFKIEPKRSLFGTKRKPNLFPVIPSFSTQDLPNVVHGIKLLMENELGSGINQIQ